MVQLCDGSARFAMALYYQISSHVTSDFSFLLRTVNQAPALIPDRTS
jgi:hypothetical protein